MNVYDAIHHGIDSLLINDGYNKDEDELKLVETWDEINSYIRKED